MTTHTTLRPLLHAFEVAELLAVSEDTVRRWLREGRLPAVRLSTHGGAVRFRAEDIEKLIDEGSTD